MNLKNKETQLFETLTKLDSIADLIKNSKEESSYLKKLSSQLEKEKEELRIKNKNKIRNFISKYFTSKQMMLLLHLCCCRQSLP